MAKPNYTSEVQRMMNATSRAEREEQRVGRIHNAARISFQVLADDWEFSIANEASPVEQMAIQRAYERAERRMLQNQHRNR